MYRCACLLISVVSASVAAQITVPHVGFLHTPDGQVRPVTGLPASFVLGNVLHNGAVSVSFSDLCGVLLGGNEVLVLGANGAVIASYPAGDQNGTAGISGAVDSSIAWLPQSRTVLWFDGSAFQKVELDRDFPGRVLSLRRDGDQASLLLEDRGTVSEAAISLSSGNMLSLAVLPGAAAPAIYMGNQVVSASTLDLPCASTSLEKMSDAWLHASCKNGTELALNLNGGAVHVTELPHARTIGRVRQIGPHAEARR